MNLSERINQHFTTSIKLQTQTIANLSSQIITAGELMAIGLQKNKILSCGNGGSAAQAQHFAAEIINRFETERRALAAISLTTDTSNLTSIANDYAFENIFSRQIEALGQNEDILLAISTSGNSPNVLKAIQAAHLKKMYIISLTGGDGGTIAQELRSTDIEIRIPSSSTARIQELHLLVIHCLCDIIDVVNT
ncbi:MAG: phosphoheptose isomerase, partial [Proteobacteria bacterium]|nr:phosphoheptose isomerase [Pseudomonadota bacterium]